MLPTNLARVLNTRSHGRRFVRFLSVSVASIGLFASASTAGTVLFAAPASAASCVFTSFTWTGADAANPLTPNSNWSDANNWQGLAAPSGCANLTFPSATGGALSIGTSNNDIANLQVNSLSLGGAGYKLTGDGISMVLSGSTAPSVTATASPVTVGMNLTLGASTTVSSGSGDVLTFSGVVSGPSTSALTTTGAGTLILTGSNSLWSGPLMLSAGTVQVSNSSALGDQSSTNTLDIESGAQLQLGPSTNPVVVSQQSLTLRGAILAANSGDTVASPISLGSSGGALEALAGKKLIVTGIISQGTSVSALTTGGAGATGTVVLGGSSSNTYTGGTIVAAGTLVLDASGSSTVTAPGSLTLDNGATLSLGLSGQLDPAGSLSVGGLLDLAGNSTKTTNLTLDSTSTSSAPTVGDSGSSGALTITGVITSTGTGLPSVISAPIISAPVSPSTSVPINVDGNSLKISGQLWGTDFSIPAFSSGTPCTSGTSTSPCVAVVLSGSSPTYSGTIDLTGGLLDLTGALPSTATVSVSSGTLTGTGTVGSIDLTGTGTLSPGTTVTVPASANLMPADEPGVLTTGTLTLDGGVLNTRIDGNTPGNGSTSTCPSGYDQVAVTGTLNMGATNTALQPTTDTPGGSPCYAPASGDIYAIVNATASSGSYSGPPTVNNTNPATNYTYSVTAPPAQPAVKLSITLNDVVHVLSSENPSTYGDSVTFTANVAPTSGSATPSGSVTFRLDNTAIPGCSNVTLSAGTANCTPATALPGGSDAIVVNYSGETGATTFTPNTGSLTQTVDPQSTTTTIQDKTTSPTTYGQTVQFVATVAGQPSGNTQATTVSPPTGTVTFLAGSNAISDCPAVEVSTTSGTTTATCNTKNLPGGTNSVTARYNADSNYSGSTSTAASHTVTAASTTTSVVNNGPNPSVFGQPVSFTATVGGGVSGAASPSGTVSFFNGANPITDCTDDTVSTTAGVTSASCNTSTLTVGSADSITATFNPGDDNYATSTSGPVSQTVNQAATSTTASSSLNPSAVGEAVTYTATIDVTSPGAGTPTGTVDFTDNGASIGCDSQSVSTTGGVTTAQCGPITYGATGTHPIVATYSGDSDFAGSVSPTLTQTVNAATSATAITSPGSPNPSVFGEPVSFTATVTGNSTDGAPTGSVTFLVGSTELSDCTNLPLGTPGSDTASATCNTSVLPVGPADSVTAQYNGDATYGASTSSAVSQEVDQAQTMTLVSSSANPSTPNETVTYTVTVSAVTPGAGTPTGDVTLTDNGTPMACSPLTLDPGTATCQTTYPTAGSHSIVATYVGDTDFASSVSPTLSQTVDHEGSTTSLTDNGPNPSVVGQSVSFSVTVTGVASDGPPTGAVTLSVASSNLTGCTSISLTASGVAKSTATCSTSALPFGTPDSVIATYSGDTVYATSASPGTNQTVRATTTTGISLGSPNPSVFGEIVSFTVTVTGNATQGTPTGTVTFFDPATIVPGCGAVALTAGAVANTATGTCRTRGLVAGTDSVTADFFGDSKYGPSASTAVDQTVEKAATATHMGASSNPVVRGAKETLTATVTAVSPGGGTPSGTVRFSVGATVLCNSALSAGKATCSTNSLPAGSDTVTATYLGNSNYKSSDASGVIKVLLPAGYYLVTGTGQVFHFGSAQSHGSLAGDHLTKPIVGMTYDPATGGYWLVASDGGVFAFDAKFLGSTGGVKLKRPIVGMAATPDGKGYWLVASDGGIFAFGDAHFYGSMGGITLKKPVVGMAVGPGGKGYWLVASDGGIFAFGSAKFHGSTGGVNLKKPIVGMTATPDGGGYWFVASDGGLFAFGDAHFHGSAAGMALASPIAGMATDLITGGYWMVEQNGTVFAFDAPALGSVSAASLTAVVVAITSI